MNNIYYENIDEHIMYTHYQGETPSVAFHLHEGYEIYFLISGDVDYFVEKNIYHVNYGDLLIINNHEIHTPVFRSNKEYHRITIEFNPSVVSTFNSKDFDLLNCFVNRPNGEQNKIPLNPKQIEDVYELFTKMERIQNDEKGNDILKLNYFVEFLVYINRIFNKNHPQIGLVTMFEKLVPILEYIDINLGLKLDIDTLAKKFFIDKYYLCKLFKKNTGISLHNYIILKRISKAKLLLSNGRNVSQTCSECGFNDYSNFLKMFKKIVGVSPGKYK